MMGTSLMGYYKRNGEVNKRGWLKNIEKNAGKQRETLGKRGRYQERGNYRQRERECK